MRSNRYAMKMRIISLLMIWSSMASNGQSAEKFFSIENFAEEIFQYIPTQRNGVLEADFKKGIFILDETRRAAQNTPDSLNVADFWNISVAFLVLQEPKRNIEIAFTKAIEEDPRTICAYLSMDKVDFGSIIPEIFYPFYNSCKKEAAPGPSFDCVTHAIRHKMDTSLLKLIYSISQRDVKYRLTTPVDFSKQAPLDHKNQEQIDSLYQVHKRYIGTSLVSARFNYVMWAVIQHAPIEMMERYLSVVEQAVKENELGVIPFKMLIDRIYSLKWKHQIFGSQSNVPLADESVRMEVKRKYSLK